jgi:phospholipid transport system transporter-binding protein
MTLTCAPGADGAGRFVVAGDGRRWTFSGALTIADARSALEAASALPLPADGVVDCAGIEAVDSAAVAVLLALKRRAALEQQPLKYANVPDALRDLGELYGVAEILAA